MGCDIVEREETPSTSGSAIAKRFKLPRKQIFDDCNGVDRVSVPRKLRSAMKKRNRESISPPSFPDSKKLNHSTGVVESSKRIGAKKFKTNLKQNWSMKHSISGPITKDEEEVVETLYALAGMFPDNELDTKTKLDSASLDASPSALPEASENHPPKEDSVGIKEDLNVLCPLRANEAVNPVSDVEKSHEDIVKFHFLIGPSICELSDFPSSEAVQGELDSSVAQVNLPKMFVKHEEQKSPSNAVKYCFPSGSHQDMGKLKQTVKLEISQLDRKSDTALELTTTIGTQLDQQHLINESKSNSSWPGLSSTVSSTFCRDSLSQSFAAKIPAWLNTTTSHGPVLSDSSTGKLSKVPTDRRSWKRCAAHVYISRLIRVLEVPESKESLQLPSNQLRPHEILKQGVLMTINDFNSNDLNGVASASSLINKIKKNPSDAKSGNLQHLRLRQDHSQPALSCGVYTSQKQGCNFLSLSAGGGGIETSLSGAGHGSEPSAQLQVPYNAQHPTIMPFSMSQAQYAPAYPDQFSAAAAQQAQLQLPPHFSSPYCGPHANPKALTKQQQQQQRFWAAQLAAQFRNNGTSSTVTQFPSWQNGRQDSNTLMPFFSSSPSTLEVLGHKYPQVSQQQQQQFMAITLPHARMKRQDHHLSSVYEDSGVGFRAGGGALPLQLLCNERL
ncbi:uncharacterized protein LOC8274655 isoform X2 [Ricinus communis]|nr:uncharacterized protein LOC8274655 isoform X2 [Ricinus communis]